MARGKKPTGTVPPSPSSAPQAVQALVDRFSDQLEVYRSGRYNEAQLRQEFLNPFFKALGWDMDNEQGYAEAYKDVIHEDAIRMEGTVKAPDYCFRVGGTRKFFLEAKKPSVDIKNEPTAAYQLRRYAWSAKLPLSVLSDFEEFAIYDCRVKPEKNDSAATARIFLCTFRDYIEKWDYLSSIFSKDAIQKGSFDKFAESSKGKRGTSEVDAAFLAEIETWRNDLARNLALRNQRLSQRELNFAVQRIIDRIIFLRICEDRGIEDYGHLMGLTNGAGIYPRLCEVFEAADARYNSGLFHFRKEKGRHEDPDELTLKLDIDDKLLRGILTRLYYPDSPYEFSVLSADILGQVYEQFLGKVIRLTAGHRAVVEDKPEVKKAGGVYYTPTYIVDYIVRQTVGKLLEGKTPKQAEKLRILDPACGSGSFLIGAYQFLLDWHRDWYSSNEPEKHAKGSTPALRQTGHGGWALTIDARKRILLNNIYGVDIDAQAVEVTKLSLLLKVLEGETGQTLQTQFQFLRERALPDIGENIKCGNSLIDHDFATQGALGRPTDNERDGINPFSWERDGFPDVFKAGGFDAVIGNPPYVRIQGFPRDQVSYLTTHYQSATGNCDLYVSFVERGFGLLASGGRLGFIVPNKFFRTDYGVGLRAFLSSHHAVCGIVDFGANQVFKATTYTCILVLLNGASRHFNYAESRAARDALFTTTPEVRDSSSLDAAAWTFASVRSASLLGKLQVGTKRLLDLPAAMSRGSSSGNDEVFLIETETLKFEEPILREPLFASDFGRYLFSPKKRWKILFPYVMEDGKYRPYTESELKNMFPRALDHLRSNQASLKTRKQYREWFGFSAPRNLDLHDQAQIAVPLLADRGLFALIPKSSRGQLCPMASGGFTITLLGNCQMRAEYVLGLLNSRLLYWRLRSTSNLFRGGWITCTKQYFGELPIRILDLADNSDQKRHDEVVTLVEEMIASNQKLVDSTTPQEQAALSRHIAATDAQIDKLVYDLYGLTSDEIKIVEEATA